MLSNIAVYCWKKKKLSGTVCTGILCVCIIATANGSQFGALWDQWIFLDSLGVKNITIQYYQSDSKQLISSVIIW